MTLVRRVARPLLAAVFISGGIDTLRNPEPRVQMAEKVAKPIGKAVPYLPDDPAQLVKLNAAVQIGAGALLAVGRFPRLAALALTGSLVPTTIAGHRFWEQEDKAAKKQQQLQFIKNLSIVGGLLLAAVDTEGQPGLGWRARHAGTAAGKAVKTSRRQARLAATSAKLDALSAVHKAAEALPLG